MALITTDYGLVTPPPGCSLDFGHPINNGLVGCWLFNEKSGSRLTDYSGKNNHGTLTNFAMNGATSNWVGSPMGGALAFDGTNDYVPIADSPSLRVEAAPFSLSIWINYKALPAASNLTTIFSKCQAGLGGNGYGVVYDLRTGTHYNLFKAGVADQKIAITAPTLGVWYNVVAVQNYAGSTPTTWNLYINGQLIGTSASNASAYQSSSGQSAYIGSTATYVLDKATNAVICGARIYKRALTQAEVSLLYSQPNIGIQSPTYYTP